MSDENEYQNEYQNVIVSAMNIIENLEKGNEEHYSILEKFFNLLLESIFSLSSDEMIQKTFTYLARTFDRLLSYDDERCVKIISEFLPDISELPQQILLSTLSETAVENYTSPFGLLLFSYLLSTNEFGLFPPYLPIEAFLSVENVSLEKVNSITEEFPYSVSLPSFPSLSKEGDMSFDAILARYPCVVGNRVDVPTSGYLVFWKKNPIDHPQFFSLAYYTKLNEDKNGTK